MNPALRQGLHEFWLFGLKQAYACIFAGTFLAIVIASHVLYPRDAALARYDALLGA